MDFNLYTIASLILVALASGGLGAYFIWVRRTVITPPTTLWTQSLATVDQCPDCGASAYGNLYCNTCVSKWEWLGNTVDGERTREIILEANRARVEDGEERSLLRG